MYRTEDSNWEIAEGNDPIPRGDVLSPRAKCLRCGVRLATFDDSQSIHDSWHASQAGSDQPKAAAS